MPRSCSRGFKWFTVCLVVVSTDKRFTFRLSKAWGCFAILTSEKEQKALQKKNVQRCISGEWLPPDWRVKMCREILRLKGVALEEINGITAPFAHPSKTSTETRTIRLPCIVLSPRSELSLVCLVVRNSACIVAANLGRFRRQEKHQTANTSTGFITTGQWQRVCISCADRCLEKMLLWWTAQGFTCRCGRGEVHSGAGDAGRSEV